MRRSPTSICTHYAQITGFHFSSNLIMKLAARGHKRERRNAPLIHRLVNLIISTT
uniref:Uncharacterized protein n=1 Tax=Arundo donax TaxID=35708 RepID=A0A0A9C8R5_ARUDO